MRRIVARQVPEARGEAALGAAERHAEHGRQLCGGDTAGPEQRRAVAGKVHNRRFHANLGRAAIEDEAHCITEFGADMSRRASG